MSSVFFATKLVKDKTLKNGSHPIALQVIFDSKKVRRIRLHLSAFLHDWDEAEDCFKRHVYGYKNLNEKLYAYLAKAERILKEKFRSDNFNYREFAEEFRKEEESSTVLAFFDRVIADLKQSGKIGTANYYKDVRNAVKKFTNGKDLEFADINYGWLEDFEKFYLNRDCSESGVSAYFRGIRAMYNKAIRKRIVEQSRYPFSSEINKLGYSFAHLKSEYVPKALLPEDIEKLANHTPSDPKHLVSLNLFLFSYFSFGTNFTDMAYLTRENIIGHVLTYKRRKTKGMIVVPLSEKAQELIDVFANGSDYLFPIMTEVQSKDPVEIKRLLKQRIRVVNSHLGKIGKELGIPRKFTFYSARHSSATMAKRKGASVEKISDLLGHSDTKITQTYLARFASTELSEVVGLLSEK